ncbi:MAG: hypothetical protein NC299_06160 [Lachnospiraceae bacterium]|nr:hypothetical protein [Ruminococcus sp.]MCM1274937.1 hypothetical protein [Lachnospiraceae bacterium]
MNNISFKQYRAIDLGIMAVILAVVEALTAKAASSWFPMEFYALSPSIAVICIVMMRWGGFAALHAVVGGAAYCLALGASAEQFAVYCVGNCAALVSLVLIKALGKRKIKDSALFTVIFTVLAFVGTELGRGLVSLIFGSPIDSVLRFFATDSLSLVFAVVVVLISRRVDGLFEDQRDYLIRTEAERRRAQSPDNFGSDNFE